MQFLDVCDSSSINKLTRRTRGRCAAAADKAGDCGLVPALPPRLRLEPGDTCMMLLVVVVQQELLGCVVLWRRKETTTAAAAVTARVLPVGGRRGLNRCQRE